MEEAATTAVEGDGDEGIVAAVGTVEGDGKAFHCGGERPPDVPKRGRLGMT